MLTPQPLFPQNRAPDIVWKKKKDWLGPRDGLGAVKKKKFCGVFIG
jgi:hypothetical protein